MNEQTFGLRDRFHIFVVSCKEVLGLASPEDIKRNEVYKNLLEIADCASSCMRLFGLTEKFSKNQKLAEVKIFQLLEDKDDNYSELIKTVRKCWTESMQQSGGPTGSGLVADFVRAAASKLTA